MQRCGGEAILPHAPGDLQQGGGNVEGGGRQDDVRGHGVLVPVGPEGEDALPGARPVRGGAKHTPSRVVRLVQQDVGALFHQG